MNRIKKTSIILLVLMLAVLMAASVYAADDSPNTQDAAAAEVKTDSEGSTVGLKALAVGIAIGLAAAGGAVGMGMVGGKAADGISRPPEMEGKIRTTLMLDLVFIETAIIYALLVVILVIFVL